jgi:hypothetical protein
MDPEESSVGKGSPRALHFFFAYGNRVHTALSGIVAGFKSWGIFSDEGGSNKGSDTESIKETIEKIYDGYMQSAIKHCDGDIQKADYSLDTSVYEYHYRLKQSNDFINWKNEQIKSQSKT